MGFTLEEIERMTPGERVEAQDRIARRYLAAKGEPDAPTPPAPAPALARGNGWPRPWLVHDGIQRYVRAPAAARGSRARVCQKK